MVCFRACDTTPSLMLKLIRQALRIFGAPAHIGISQISFV